jgi:hypothetical protein
MVIRTPIAINKQQPTAMITTPPEEATETPRRPTHHLITTPPEEATETSRRPTHHHYSPSKHTIAPTRLVQCTKSLVMSREQKCTLLRQNQFPKDFKKLPKNQSINTMRSMYTRDDDKATLQQKINAEWSPKPSHMQRKWKQILVVHIPKASPTATNTTY